MDSLNNQVNVLMSPLKQPLGVDGNNIHVIMPKSLYPMNRLINHIIRMGMETATSLSMLPASSSNLDENCANNSHLLYLRQRDFSIQLTSTNLDNKYCNTNCTQHSPSASSTVSISSTYKKLSSMMATEAQTNNYDDDTNIVRASAESATTALISNDAWAANTISNQQIFMVSLVTTVRLILVILASVLIFKLLKLKQQQNKQYKYSTASQQSSSSQAYRESLAKLKLPPGPSGLPILGFFPFVGKELHVTLTNLSHRYGPIYQIFLGGIRVVILNDAKLIRDAFKQPVFSGRPNTRLTRILQGYGIVNSDGALWKEQRAFLHSVLRKLGAKSLIHGRNGLEAKIQCHVKEFVGDLSVHATSGQSCQVRPVVARAVSSVVGALIMNLTYKNYEEKEKFDRLIELMQEGFRLFTIAMPVDFVPLFRFLPGVSYAFQKIKKNRAETSAFFQQIANEHREYINSSTREYDDNQVSSTTANQPKNTTTTTDNLEDEESDNLRKVVTRDLVDAYIVQQRKHEKDGKLNYFSDAQLVQIMSDIFSAGLETVTSTIEWSILFLMLNNDCQERIQTEIDNIIGRDRMPQLDDLVNMPYTEATIYEVLRRSNVIALGNAHATLDDATIGGYLIPKGTHVLPNFYGIHMDPKLWENPEKFDPTRFLVNEKAIKPDYFIPFSVGRRMCLGDVLTKMEVFLFVVGLLQKYDLSVAEEDRLDPPKVKGIISISMAPNPFKVALTSRRPFQAS